MLYNAFRCWKVVFGCPRGAFGYAEYEAWAAKAEGIRIPKDGIRMLKMVSGCQIKAFEYTGTMVSECGKMHPDTL